MNSTNITQNDYGPGVLLIRMMMGRGPRQQLILLVVPSQIQNKPKQDKPKQNKKKTAVRQQLTVSQQDYVKLPDYVK
jgi:hypothetical protein